MTPFPFSSAKARRLARRADNEALKAQLATNAPDASKSNGDGPRPLEQASDRPSATKRPRKRRKKLPRRVAFDRLKALCREYVMLRAKARGGFCEVAMACSGRGPIEVPYHVTPQAMGNALKYDDRNLLGSCSRCNGSEYFARKRGSSLYRKRHAAILGPVFAELEATAGRKQISTAEAVEMADRFKARIESGEWRHGKP